MVVIPACFEVTLKELKGVYSDGDPPLPMPNREVKPVSADGTAPGWESRSMPDFQIVKLSFSDLWRGSSAG